MPVKEIPADVIASILQRCLKGGDVNVDSQAMGELISNQRSVQAFEGIENGGYSERLKGISYDDINRVAYEVYKSKSGASKEDYVRAVSRLHRIKRLIDKEAHESAPLSAGDARVFFRDAEGTKYQHAVSLNGIAFTDVGALTDLKKRAEYTKHKDKPKAHGKVGAIVLERDDSGEYWAWLHYPVDHQHQKQGFYGKIAEFTRGDSDATESPQQAAVREAWEEMGLVVDVHDTLTVSGGADVQNYYVAKRVGGKPWKWANQGVRKGGNLDETSAVKLVKLSELDRHFGFNTNTEDQKILTRLRELVGAQRDEIDSFLTAPAIKSHVEAIDHVKAQLGKGRVAFMREGVVTNGVRVGWYNANDFKNREFSPARADDTVVLFGGNYNHIAQPQITQGGGQAAAASPYANPGVKEGTFAFPITTVYGANTGITNINRARAWISSELLVLKLAIKEGAKIVIPTDNAGVSTTPGDRSDLMFRTAKGVRNADGDEIAKMISGELRQASTQYQGNAGDSIEAVRKLREFVRLRAQFFAEKKMNQKSIQEFQKIVNDNCTDLDGADLSQLNLAVAQALQASKTVSKNLGNSIISYEINEATQSLKITGIKTAEDLGISVAEYQNLFDVEFAPMIWFYKNHGNVEKAVETTDPYILWQLGRIVPDSQITGSKPDFAELQRNLAAIESEKGTDLKGYLEKISHLVVDQNGCITQDSFLKHGRINGELPELSGADFDGGYWYRSATIEKAMEAYAIEAGFVKDGAGLEKFAKDGNLAFFAKEFSRGDELNLEGFLNDIKTLSVGKKAQIFVPVNFYGGHWTMLEIEIKKDVDNNFTVKRNYFNPLGRAGISDELDEQIMRSAKMVFGEGGIGSGSRAKAFESKTQNDGSSCGPISCWYAWQRMKGESCGERGEKFESGAQDLRCAQVKLIAKHIGLDRAYVSYSSGYAKRKFVAPPVFTKRSVPAKSAQQKECERILQELEAVKEGTVGFLHSITKEIFREELDSILEGKAEGALKDRALIKAAKVEGSTLNKVIELLCAGKSREAIESLKDNYRATEKDREELTEKLEEGEDKKRFASAKEVYQHSVREVFATGVDVKKKAALRDKVADLVLPQRLSDALRKGDEMLDGAEFTTFLLDAIVPEENKLTEVNATTYAGGVRVTTDQQTKLDMPLVAGANSCSQVLSDYQVPERMEGENQYQLDNGRKVDAQKQLKISVKKPNVDLVISFKRFRYDKQTGQSTRIADPITLDAITVPTADGVGQKYEATAFIVHRSESGTSVMAGHYVTYVKEDDNKWYLYNDTERTEVEEKDLENGLPTASKIAYMVKYSPLADESKQGSARYKTGLPASQRVGTSNGGNRCWANAAFAFALAIQSLHEGALTPEPEPKPKSTSELSYGQELLSKICEFVYDDTAHLKELIENLGHLDRSPDREACYEKLEEMGLGSKDDLIHSEVRRYLSELAAAENDIEKRKQILSFDDFLGDKKNRDILMGILDDSSGFRRDPNGFIVSKGKKVPEKKSQKEAVDLEGLCFRFVQLDDIRSFKKLLPKVLRTDKNSELLTNLLCCAVIGDKTGIVEILIKDHGADLKKRSVLYGKTAEEIIAELKSGAPVPPAPQPSPRPAPAPSIRRSNLLYLTPEITTKHISPAAVFDPVIGGFKNINTSSQEPVKKVIVISNNAFEGCRSEAEAIGEIKKLVDEGFTVLLRNKPSSKQKFTKYEKGEVISDVEIAWSNNPKYYGQNTFVTRAARHTSGLVKDDYSVIAENFGIPREQLLVLAHLTPQEKHQALPELFDKPRKTNKSKANASAGSGARISLADSQSPAVGEIIRDKVYGRVSIQDGADLTNRLKEKHKNILIKVDGDVEDLEAHANYLIKDATSAHRPVFCLDSFEQVHSGRGYLSIVTEMEMGDDGFFQQTDVLKFAKDSPLVAFLKKHNNSTPPPLIVINWDKFNAKQKVALNSLIDQERKIGDVVLSEGTQIVSLKSLRPGEDVSFESRHDFSAKSDLQESDLPIEGESVVKLSQPRDPMEMVQQIHLVSTDWREELFGSVAIVTADFGSKAGQKVLTNWGGYSTMIEHNPLEHGVVNFDICGLPPQEEEEFVRAVKRARATGKFVHNGREVKFRPEVRFNLVPFNFGRFDEAENLAVTKNAVRDADVERHTINSQLFPLLMRRRNIADGEYEEVDGLLVQATKKAHTNPPQTLKLFISSPLSEAQWNYLFSEAFDQKWWDRGNIKLDLQLAPGVELPQGVKFNEVAAAVGPARPKAKIIVSTNADESAKGVAGAHAIIDVTDLTYQDLAGQIDFIENADCIPTDVQKNDGLLQSNKKIVLKGKFSPELLQMLEQDILNAGDNFTFIIEDKDGRKPLSWLDSGSYVVEAPTTVVAPVQSITSQEGVDWNSLNNSASESRKFIQERKNNLSQLLGANSMIQLNGHSGVGKSSLIREYEEEHKADAVVYRELSDLKKWAQDTTAGKTKILFIDESNIEKSHLTVFDPLKPGGNKRIFCDGEFIELTADHKVVFSCNPKEYGGGRADQKLFEDGSIPALKLYGFPACYIYEKLLKEAIGQGVEEANFKKVCEPLIAEFRSNQMAATIPDEDRETVRELQQKVLAQLVEAEYVEIESENFISTEATKAIEQQLRTALEIKELQRESALTIRSGIGLNGILLEGDSGTGKSELIKAMLEHKGITERKLSDTILAIKRQYYKIDASLPLEEKRKIITKAYEEGNVVWIDEINSCLDDGLEKALNLALAGDHPEGTKGAVVRPGFMLISSVNSINLDGRSEISPALRHRTVQCEVKPALEYSQEDVTKIVKHWLENADQQKAIVAALGKELTDYKEGEMTPISLTCFYERAKDEMGVGFEKSAAEAKAREYLQEARDQFAAKHSGGALDPELVEKLSKAIGREMFGSFRDPNITGFRAFKSSLTEIAAKHYALCYQVDYDIEQSSPEPTPEPTPRSPRQAPPAPLGNDVLDVPFEEGENLKITAENEVKIICKERKTGVKKNPTIKDNPLLEIEMSDDGNTVTIGKNKFRKAALEYYRGKKQEDDTELEEEEITARKVQITEALNVYRAAPNTSFKATSVSPLSPRSVARGPL